MKLTCPHKTSDSICANCVVQLIEQAVGVEHAKVEKLRRVYRELLIRIANSYKGSIGSFHNTYLPQLNREDIDQALADTASKEGK